MSPDPVTPARREQLDPGIRVFLSLAIAAAAAFVGAVFLPRLGGLALPLIYVVAFVAAWNISYLLPRRTR